jgi:hypothetical protein
MAMTPIDYGDVFEALERNSVSYVVVGGVAVFLHGRKRAVMDLDIVISSAPDEQNHALQTLMRAGFVPSIPVSLHFLRVLRMFDQSAREIDLLLKYHIPFSELSANAEQIRLGQCIARVASLDHVLQAKRITARPEDLADVDALLALASGSTHDRDTEHRGCQRKVLT